MPSATPTSIIANDAIPSARPSRPASAPRSRRTPAIPSTGSRMTDAMPNSISNRSLE